MGRRSKQGAADDWIRIVALLPWWAGVALALVFYIALHRMAEQPVLTAADPTKINSMIVGSMLHAAATVGQYVLPLLCLAGAAVSAIGRRKRQTLVDNVGRGDASDALNGMSWREFEQLVGEGFRLQGYQVLETGGGGADGGVDLILTRPARNGNEKVLVQCKQWRAFKVGVDVVRELYGVMAASGAAGGFVITSGRFTDEAVRFADGRNIGLIDGPQLLDLLRQARASRGQASPRPMKQPNVEVEDGAVLTLACPACAKPMIQRTAKRGTNAGQAFWGCTAYPACRGTRSIA